MDDWEQIATVALPILLAAAGVIALVVFARRPPDWDRHAPRTDVDFTGRWEDGVWVGPPEQQGSGRRVLYGYLLGYLPISIALQVIPKPARWWLLLGLGVALIPLVGFLVVRARRKRSTASKDLAT